MDHEIKVTIKLLSLDDSSSSDIEDDEFTILSKGKDEVCRYNELNYWFRVSLELHDLIHLLPLYNTVIV